MSDGEPRKDPDREANERLGAAVAGLRRQAGLTRTELGERAEMREQQVTALETGELEPTWGDLRRIAYALEMPLAELLAQTEG